MAHFRQSLTCCGTETVPDERMADWKLAETRVGRRIRAGSPDVRIDPPTPAYTKINRATCCDRSSMLKDRVYVQTCFNLFGGNGSPVYRAAAGHSRRSSVCAAARRTSEVAEAQMS